MIYTALEKQKQPILSYIKNHLSQCTVTEVPDKGDEYAAQAEAQFGEGQINGAHDGAHCIGMVLTYVKDVMQSDISHINHVERIDSERRLFMDAASLQHLEVTHNVRDGGRKGTLLEVLDHTATAMGGRLLRKWLEAPLLRIPDIVQRQDAVEEMVQREILRNDVKESLERIYDFERILTRIETGTVNPKDLVALRESLSVIPNLRKSLEQASSSLLRQLRLLAQSRRGILTLMPRH